MGKMFQMMPTAKGKVHVFSDRPGATLRTHTYEHTNEFPEPTREQSRVSREDAMVASH